MINDLELEELNDLITELNEKCRLYWYDDIMIDNDNLDYGELKRSIYETQNEIKEIVEGWN